MLYMLTRWHMRRLLRHLTGLCGVRGTSLCSRLGQVRTLAVLLEQPKLRWPPRPSVVPMVPGPRIARFPLAPTHRWFGHGSRQVVAPKAGPAVGRCTRGIGAPGAAERGLRPKRRLPAALDGAGVKGTRGRGVVSSL